MKTLLLAVTLMLNIVALSVPALAQEKEEKPKLNLSELAKSAELIKKYKALLDNPEGLQAMMRLAESLKNKQASN